MQHVPITPRPICQHLCPWLPASAHAYTIARIAPRGLKMNMPQARFLISPIPLNLFLHHSPFFFLSCLQKLPSCMYAIKRSFASQAMRQSHYRGQGGVGTFPAFPEDATHHQTLPCSQSPTVCVCGALCLLRNIPFLGHNEEEKLISY